MSVALAAEYLGQSESTVKAAIIEEEDNNGKQKKEKKKKKKKEKDRDEREGEKKKKKKKKKKKEDEEEEEPKPKQRLGVKDLVSRLEPKLFKDLASGTKMVMSQESARRAMSESKKAGEPIALPTDKNPTGTSIFFAC